LGYPTSDSTSVQMVVATIEGCGNERCECQRSVLRPYDFAIDGDPYPVWRRLREEAPLYYNEKHDFYALSRFDDVEKGLTDWKTYSSAKACCSRSSRRSWSRASRYLPGTPSSKISDP